MSLDPTHYINEVKASDTEVVPPIKLTKARTVSITVRLTYNVSATGGVRVNLYYSPDGENYDTAAYAYFDLDLSAGVEVQETAIIDTPETGWLKTVIQNLDSSVSATGVKVWAVKTRWTRGD